MIGCVAMVGRHQASMSMDYRKEIDGLRALAVLSVMFFHAGIEVFSGGFVGVDVFFVISGYLITTVILAELVQGKFSIFDFYERRARRILPALFLVVFVCIPFAWYWLRPSDMKDFSQSVIAVSLFVSNLFFWSRSGYFDTAAEIKPLLHTWSLAVEEQFYVFFPLFVIFLWRRGSRWLITALGLAFASSLAVAQWAAYVKPAAAFYLLPTRAWELLIGSVVAFYVAKTKGLGFGRREGELGGWVGVALVSYAVFFYDKATPFPGFYALVPTLGAALIILFATKENTVGRFVGNRFLVGVGLVSYSAYLWHQPLFAFLRYSSHAAEKKYFLALSAFALALAYVTWKYVETPFRNKEKYSRKKVFILSLLGVSFLISFGVYGYRSDGFGQRARMAVFKDLAYDTSKLGYKECDNTLTNEEPRLNYCMSASSASNALVIGDSHADDKFYGIERNVPGYRWKLVGNSSCPPLIGVRVKSVDGVECTDRLAKLFSYIESDSSIRLVVLSFAHMYPLDNLVAADHIQMHFDPQNSVLVDVDNPRLNKVDAFYAGLARTIDFLEARDIKVVVALDIPELNYFPSECLGTFLRCDFSRRDVLSRQSILRDRVSMLTSGHEKVYVFDPLDLFCSEGADKCSILLGGRTLYRDSHHLTHYGSFKYGEFFSKWLSQKLQ